MKRPVALTIAGSDSGGGAGVQADLRAFWALGCFGTSALTCITAQNLEGLLRVDPLPPESVAAQIQAVARGFRVRAVKTGMLFSRPLIEAVISSYDRSLSGVPLVVDPVMVAASGARLLRDDAVEAYGELFRRAAVVTPNADELAVLAGERPRTPAELESAARRLFDRLERPVLAKGGHLEGEAVDVLVTRAGSRRWSSPRVEGVNTHGSGCSLASAVAAGLAAGRRLPEAIERAKRWLDTALQEAAEVESAGGTVRLLDGASGAEKEVERG